MKWNMVKLPSESTVFAALHHVLTTPLSEDMDVFRSQISNTYQTMDKINASHSLIQLFRKEVLIVEVNTVLLIRQNSGTKVSCFIFYVQRPYGVTIQSNCQCNQHFMQAANFQN
jgi:hypothetical protein